MTDEKPSAEKILRLLYNLWADQNGLEVKIQVTERSEENVS